MIGGTDPFLECFGLQRKQELANLPLRALCARVVEPKGLETLFENVREELEGLQIANQLQTLKHTHLMEIKSAVNISEIKEKNMKSSKNHCIKFELTNGK